MVKKKKLHIGWNYIFFLFITILIIGFLFVFIERTRVSQDVQTTDAAIVSPVKTALVYNIHKDRSTNEPLSTTTLAQKLNMWIVSSSHEARVQQAKSLGNSGPTLQYILLDSFTGPSGLSSLTAQKTPCTTSQKEHDPFSNNITYNKGDFCQIHDSIVRKTAFDHDLNSSTPNIVANESWFVHDAASSARIMRTTSDGARYYPNPANLQVREYFAGRLLNEKNRRSGNFDGIFLDNVALSWENVRNQAMPKEFGTSGSYVDAVHGFVGHIHRKLSVENKYPVYGNLISGNNDGNQWDRFSPVMDGAMLESFALEWGRGPFTAAKIQSQMTQAEKWIRDGNSYIAIAQGTETNNTNLAKFALAAFLMVTDGQRGYFHYTDYNRMYSYLYDYPEYTAKLGLSRSAKVQVSTSPLLYRRAFECGEVELNITNTSSKYTIHSNCQPTNASPTGTQTNTPTKPPTPIQTQPTCQYGPYQIPGRVESENYSCGGEGVGYHEITQGNAGGSYRQDNVDVQSTADIGGGYNIGWTDKGEWLRYNVQVNTNGLYTIKARVASQVSTGKFSLKMNGVVLGGIQTVPNTGNWQTYTTMIIPNIQLQSGNHTLELFIEEPAANFNYIDFEYLGSTQNTLTIRANGTAAKNESGVMQYPHMYIKLNGSRLSNHPGWDVTGTYTNYSYSFTDSVRTIEIEYANDNETDPNNDRNLNVDYIVYNGKTYQSEALTVYSEGAWTSNTYCQGGYKSLQTLHCNGFFRFTF